jgi:hypothetical protein
MPQGAALPDIQTWGEHKVKTEKPDVDLKSMTPLSTYGPDEEYINNKFWLNGISSLILHGVGDGMIVWCALQLRIPILCMYDRDLHKKTIEAFLLDKIIKKMEEATPKDTRWYRTDLQLGCRSGEDDPEGAAKAAASAKAAAAKAAASAKTAAAKALAAPKAKNKRPNEVSPEDGESSEDDSSSSSKKKPKLKEEV